MSKPSSPRPFGSATVLRAVDACLFGALLIGLVEAGSAIAGGGFGVLASLHVLAVALVVGGVAAAFATGLSFLSARASRADALRPAWFGLAAALLLALPPIGTILRVGLSPGPALFILLAVGVGVGVAAYRVGARSSHGIDWLVGCAVAMQLVDTAADSINLAARIRPDAVEVPLALAASLYLGSLPVAMIIARLLAAIRGRSVPPRTAYATLAFAFVLALMAANLSPGLYRGVRLAAFGFAFAFAALGFSGAGPRLHWRWHVGALVPALALVVHLRVTSSPVDPTSWQLGSRTALVSELLRSTGMLASGFEELRAELERLPAATEGAASLERAAAWNRGQFEREDQGSTDGSVVLITVDTLRYDHVGYSGQAPPGLTPALDRLARRSTRFHRAYAQGGWTSLSIPSLMWSRHPERIQFTRVFEDAWFTLHFEDEVDPARLFPRAFQSPRAEPDPNLAESLTAAGLTTLAVTNDGFTHYFEPRIGLVRGFGQALYPRNVAARDDPEHVPFEIRDASTVDLALDLLAAHRDERVFLWVHLFGPHEPYDRWPDARPEWSAYQSEVHTVDREIGRLIDGLNRGGHADDTTVIVTGDHGEALNDHGSKGHGLQAYEESIRVPLLIATPARERKGEDRDIDQVVGLIDLAPTISHRLGVAAQPSFEGFDLAPALRGEAFDRPPVLSETWRVPVRGDTRDPHLLSVIDGPRKVVIDLRHSTLAFFDLETDPSERDNLAASIDSAQRERYLWLTAFALGVHDAAR